MTLATRAAANSRQFRKTFLAALVAILLLPSAGAEQAAARADPAAAADEDFLGEVPVVLSASRLRQPISETPVAMTVIDRSTIEASGIRDIADLFRLVPGVYVRAAVNVEGVVPEVSYHGMAGEFSRRMQVLIDGRSVYMPPFSTVLWDDLPLAIDDIERIEVTRGPNAASYGANAFSGTVNIITRTPVAGDGAYAFTRAGSQGVRDDVARYVDSIGSNSVRVTAGHHGSDGFPNLYNAQDHDYLSMRLDRQVDARNLVQIQAGFSEGRRQLGDYGSNFNAPRTQGLDDGYAQVRWQRATSADDELSLQYYYERKSVHESEATGVVPLPGVPPQSYALNADYHFERNDLELQQTLQPLPDLRLVAGAGLREDGIYAPLYFNGQPGPSSNLQRVFAHAEWRPLEALILQAGGMLERTSISGSRVEPRASATWRVDENQTLRAGVSCANRIPSLFEAQGDFVLPVARLRIPIEYSGGSVQSEQTTSLELGYHGSLLRRALQIDVKAYRDHAARLIDEVYDPVLSARNRYSSVFKLINAEDARLGGIEGEVHLDLPTRTRLGASYADTLITVQQNPGAAPIARQMPRQIASLMADQRLGTGWEASTVLFVNTGIPGQSGIPGQQLQAPTGFESRLDARLSHLWKWVRTEWKLAAGVQNVLPGFVEFKPETTFTRRFYAELSAHL